jgi:LysM repeat protein
VASVRRFAWPAALLAAVTIAALLVRHAVADDSPARPAAPAAAAKPARQAPARPSTAERTTAAPPANAVFHEIRAGDTLGTVADRYDTSVEALVELNPGIDPVALQVGQPVRVK